MYFKDEKKFQFARPSWMSYSADLIWYQSLNLKSLNEYEVTK